MALRPEPELGWLPTHIQVTIMQAKGLRAKGKHGTSDAFTLIQIGREKYSTSVVEKTSGSPEWKEECSFELAPGALERGEGCALQLTIMHRALIGMDQFLGQVSIPLQEVYKQGRSLRNQWYKLCSKPSRKEKERGEIQVSIQFTRNNLTASMFDLSIKDKPKTPFGKLKDKMKVKKLFDMESSSAIVPSSVGRLDSDDEDDRKPKTKGAFFLKGRLRKNSLTRSNTSLGSDSTISSASGTVPTSTGVSIVVPDVGKKPAVRNSSLSSEPADHEASPRMTHKRAFSDEVGQVKMFPEPKAIQDMKSTSSPISKSSLCINGSHVYNEVPLPKPSPSPLEKSTPQSRSFQNFVKKTEDPVAHEGLRAAPPTIIPEVKNVAKATGQPQESEDVRHEFKPVHITTPLMFSENTSKTKSHEGVGKDEKKPKVNHYGTGDKGVAEQAPHGSVNAEERGKAGGWFGSKDTKDAPQKPSPHPVKPISATVPDPGQEKKPSKPALSAALSSGLEKLKSVAGGHPQTVKNPDLDRFKDLCTPDVAAKYYHLTHDELIHLLLQKEVDLGKKDEHVRELEEYIDKLLVRIMEQAPTLLQAPLETKKDKKC
uniref:Rab11 family-interacting protein 5 n=1 Tax=Leptobrachium leishanense TaxID=445787 RepID=A0A8C5QQL1_9ANUR